MSNPEPQPSTSPVPGTEAASGGILRKLIADIQGDLDDAVGDSEIKEGLYMRLCNKLKRLNDHKDNEIVRAKVDVFAQMTDYDAENVTMCLDDINAFDPKVIYAVFQRALHRNNSEFWWEAAMDSYIGNLFDPALKWPAPMKMNVMRDLTLLSKCKQAVKLIEALEKKDVCFLCAVHDDVGEKTLKNFALDIVSNSAIMIVNPHRCGKSHKINFKMLQTVAQQYACGCTWKDPGFRKVVEPLPHDIEKRKFSLAELYTDSEHSDSDDFD